MPTDTLLDSGDPWLIAEELKKENEALRKEVARLENICYDIMAAFRDGKLQVLHAG